MNILSNRHGAGLSALVFCLLLLTVTACETPTDPAADAPEPPTAVAPQTGPANEALQPGDDATDAMRKHSASCWETGAVALETNAALDRVDGAYSSSYPTRIKVTSLGLIPVIVEVTYSATGTLTGDTPQVLNLGTAGSGIVYVAQPGSPGFPQTVDFTVKATAVYPDFGSTIAIEIEANTCTTCPGASVCRGLVEGDPYYSGWSSCCDTEEGKSYWVSRSGSSGTYNGDCCYWGIEPL